MNGYDWKYRALAIIAAILFAAVFFWIACETAWADLIITRDSSSPVSDLLVPTNGVATLGVFRLADIGSEGLNVNEIDLSCYNGDLAVDTFYLYHGSTLLQAKVGGASPNVLLSTGQLVIPANGSVAVTVKAQFLPIDGVSLKNGTCVWTGITTDDAITAKGLASGQLVTSGSQRATSSKTTVVKARPSFALDPSSPSGQLFPGSATTLAIFDVANVNGGADVTFSGGQSNKLVVNISRDQAWSDGIANTWKLTDGAGTTYSVASVADNATSVAFNFEVSDLVVSLNQTKKLYVIGDTHEFVHQSDAIQVALSSDSPGNLSYSVDFGDTLQYGDLVFRGNIYGNALVVPEPATMVFLAMGGIGFMVRRRR